MANILASNKQQISDWPVVQTADGSLTLMCPYIDEAFHSYSGARLEARDLYVVGSGLENAFLEAKRGPLSVLDVGLGLGYNACVAIDTWRALKCPPSLHLYSLELRQDLVEGLLSGAMSWQVNWDRESIDFIKVLSASRLEAKGRIEMQIKHPFEVERNFKWTVLIGDAVLSLNEMDADQTAFDFIWQDPFSPQKSPELWSTEWFRQLRRLANSATVLATYSVAGVVREALAGAGWSWQKIPTSGQKRSWLLARVCHKPLENSKH